jgi:hypothetical protein
MNAKNKEIFDAGQRSAVIFEEHPIYRYQSALRALLFVQIDLDQLRDDIF